MKSPKPLTFNDIRLFIHRASEINFTGRKESINQYCTGCGVIGEEIIDENLNGTGDFSPTVHRSFCPSVMGPRILGALSTNLILNG